MIFLVSDCWLRHTRCSNSYHFVNFIEGLDAFFDKRFIDRSARLGNVEVNEVVLLV